MSDALEIGAIGLNAQQRALDVLAGNIANINTPAFKRSNVTFSDLLMSASDPVNPSADLQPARQSAGVVANSLLALNQPGEIKHTGQALDIAIAGDGFLELLGPRGTSILWRGGTLSVQDDGLLCTSEGVPLRSMITVPKNASDLRISADGAVTAAMSDGTDRLDLGRIDLVRIMSPEAVSSLDGGYYRIDDPRQIEPIDINTASASYLVQGGLEQSNVNLNDEMVQLMIVQRSYAANAQVIQAADQLASINNTLRR